MKRLISTLAALAVTLIATTFAADAARLEYGNDGRLAYAGPEAKESRAPARRATQAHAKRPQAAISARAHAKNGPAPSVAVSAPMGEKAVDFSARRARHARSGVRYARRGSGACDGFQRCRCGTTAARNFGISYAHNGWNLKQANQWRHFPRTGFAPGTAGVKEHHVVQVVGGSSCANATVRDESNSGQPYQRNVCNMTFHSVGGGGGATYAASSPRRGRSHTMSARSHHGVAYANADRPQFQYGNLSLH